MTRIFYVVVVAATIFTAFTNTASADDNPRFGVLDRQYRVEEEAVRFRFGLGSEIRTFWEPSGGVGVTLADYDGGKYFVFSPEVAIGGDFDAFYFEAQTRMHLASDNYRRWQPTYLGLTPRVAEYESYVGLEIGFQPFATGLQIYGKFGWWTGEFDVNHEPVEPLMFGAGLRYAIPGIMKFDIFTGFNSEAFERFEGKMAFPIVNNARSRPPNRRHRETTPRYTAATLEFGPYVGFQYSKVTWDLGQNWTRTSWMAEIGVELIVDGWFTLNVGFRYGELMGEVEGVTPELWMRQGGIILAFEAAF